MKVLHLLSSKIYSGAENVVCQIISLAEEFPELEMVYCASEGPVREELIKRGVPFELMPQISVANARAVIRHQKPDIIHTHDMRAGVVAAISCGRIPMVCHIHNSDPRAGKLSVKSILFLPAAWKAKKIFWVAEAAYDGYVFRKLVSRKSTVLRNIVDVERVLQKAVEDTYGISDYDVLFIGRFEYPKNPQRFVRVINEIAKSFSQVRAAMIGTGSIEVETSPYIEMLGFRSNPYPVLRQAKVLLMTSDWEGLPLVALEAMALGVPVVSTSVDGLKGIIESGVNGYLCDDEDDLAEKVKRILEDKELRDRLSVAQRELSEKINDRTVYFEHLRRCYTIDCSAP